MSMWADYIKDRENKECIEDETGFVTYQVSGKDCYIMDLYVRPQYRGRSSEVLMKILIGLIKEIGCTRLFASVVPTTKDPTRSIKCLLYLKFNLFSASENFILLMKEI